MKKWLIFGKWVQSSGALPPRQFYTQFRNKKGKLQLGDPPADEIKVFFEAGASRGGGQKMNRTHSMARVVHLPTKKRTTARCQDTRWPKENEELALLNVRYQLDKLINQNSIVARYEAELEEFLKNEKIIKEEHRNEEVESFRNEKIAQILNFKLRNSHVLVLEEQGLVKYAETGHQVAVEGDIEEAKERLRKEVAEWKFGDL
ncbi:unnamed protein product [Oikopleura dioica]|uniref:Prokaryotic-type class I peptide chain release factors domain-containing protein n=1 Tax=Oikopleura dioica TaxID=34765 RepID=E4X0I9_OIKDI|nr:unnamed protein product [Oikopleura dioica]